jgi:hypothetical protein
MGRQHPGDILKLVRLSIFSLCFVAAAAYSQSRIVCEPDAQAEQLLASIWPVPYLSDKGALCFDVKGWPGYAGQNCVTNGGHISWKSMVIVTVDGESQGRDLTSFRVVSPIVNNERLEYVIEWSRDSVWQAMQRVKINRLSGEAVSYFITMHGGDSYQCHLERRKL